MAQTFIKGIMDKFIYLDVVKYQLIPFTEEYMLKDWIYQTDNDFKHTTHIIKTFLNEQNINVMKWPALKSRLKSHRDVMDWHE